MRTLHKSGDFNVPVLAYLNRRPNECSSFNRILQNLFFTSELHKSQLQMQSNVAEVHLKVHFKGLQEFQLFSLLESICNVHMIYTSLLGKILKKVT